MLGEIEDVGEGIWGSAEMFAVRAWSVKEVDDARAEPVRHRLPALAAGHRLRAAGHVNHDFASGVDCGEEPCRDPCKHRGDPEHECLSKDDVDNACFWRSIGICRTPATSTRTTR